MGTSPYKFDSWRPPGDNIWGQMAVPVSFYTPCFRPSFLEDSVYVPVCLPAFRPDRCVREDGDDQEGRGIADNLRKLHADSKSKCNLKVDFKICRWVGVYVSLHKFQT